MAVPPRRYRAAAFFNKNRRQTRGGELLRVCMHAYDPARASALINANRKEPLRDANQSPKPRRLFPAPSKPLPHLPPPLCCFLETVSLGLSSVVLLSSAWLFFFRQRELSNVTFVRRERAAAASRLAANQGRDREAAGTRTSSLTTGKKEPEMDF